MAEYYVVRDKNTGLYFRGKGVNRWGKYYNQASVYRIKANAENTIKEVSWRGEQAEVVPIQIIETPADVAPKSDVAREIFEEIERLLDLNCRAGDIFTGKYFDIDLKNDIAEIKKKYTEGQE